MLRSNRSIAIVAVALLGATCSRTESVGNYPTDGGLPGPDANTSEGGPGSVGKYPTSDGHLPGPDANTSDSPGPASDAMVSPSCRDFGQVCGTGADCCSGLCDPATGTCVSSINKCTTTGGACQSSTECCSLVCSAGRCSATSCIADNKACADSASCCGGNCSGGVCQALTKSCLTAGNPCADSAQCCSSLCQGGVCKLGSSFCIQAGDVCSDSATCCSGECKKGTGMLGTCAAPPSGSTYCSDGVDGTVCSACNGCCSRLCAPYAPTGVRVCQPASGCRVNGDLCRKDSDCCGAAGTGLPGDGNVVCEIEVGKLVGICRNPHGCNPQGNVCHYQNYTCSISSARDDCCAPTGKGVCQIDTLGVPRCSGLGNTCRQGGETCSSAMDCCNRAPCVPDPSGVLHCYGPPSTGIDGGVPSKCVPGGGPCSINGDCCVGTTCIQPIGTTQGTCGAPGPPSGPPSGLDAGTPDSSTPGCAEYGQTCKTDSDCCNGVSCSGGTCMDQIIL